MRVAGRLRQHDVSDRVPIRSPRIGQPALPAFEPERRYPSLLSLATIGLALATALVLLQLAHLLVTPVATVDRGHAHRLLVHRFYDAVNITLATGDTHALNNLVAPSLSIPMGDPLIETRRIGLADRLLSLHHAQPTLQFVVRDIFADARTAIAWVALEGASSDRLVATPLSAMGGEAIDRITIVDGQIVELHGILWDITPSVLFAQGDLQRPAPDVQIGLARMTLDGSTAPFALSALGPIVIVVESGSVKVQGGTSGTWSRVSDGTLSAASTIDVGVTRELSPGDQFVSAKGSPFVLLNDSQTPASVLVVAMIPLSEWTRSTSGNSLNTHRSTIIMMMNEHDDTRSQTNNEFPPGVRATRIAVQFASLEDRGYRLRLERIDLAPNAEMLTQSHSPARLIAVEHDAEGLIAQRRDENGLPEDVTFMTNDDPLFIQPPRQASVRNLGERGVTLLMLSWQ